MQICYTNDLKMGAGGGHRGKYGCPSGNYRELSHICYSNDLKMGGGHRGKYGCPSGNYKELTQIWMGTNLYTYQNQEIHQEWKSHLYHGVVSRIV